MEIRRVKERWEVAAVHYLRIQVALSLNIPVRGEIDEKEGDQLDYLLIMDGDTPAATGRLRNYEGKAKFERITVGVAYQRKGIGHLLIEEMEKWAYELGFREIFITGKQEVQDFYLKAGYATNGEVIQTGIFPLVHLTKTLGLQASSA